MECWQLMNAFRGSTTSGKLGVEDIGIEDVGSFREALVAGDIEIPIEIQKLLNFDATNDSSQWNPFAFSNGMRQVKGLWEQSGKSDSQTSVNLANVSVDAADLREFYVSSNQTALEFLLVDKVITPVPMIAVYRILYNLFVAKIDVGGAITFSDFKDLVADLTPLCTTISELCIDSSELWLDPSIQFQEGFLLSHLRSTLNRNVNARLTDDIPPDQVSASVDYSDIYSNNVDFVDKETLNEPASEEPEINFAEVVTAWKSREVPIGILSPEGLRKKLLVDSSDSKQDPRRRAKVDALNRCVALMESIEDQFRERWDKLEVRISDLRGALQDVWFGFYPQGRRLTLAELEEVMLEFDAWITINSFTPVLDASVLPIFVAWFFRVLNEFQLVSRKI